jgi:SAM-dependent methyltransferase
MPNTFYTDARIYDILHDTDTAHEVDALEAIAKRFCPHALTPGATWLEPACGTARHLRLLAKRKRSVLGFDAEPAMVRFARHSLGSRVFRARFDDFLIKRPRIKADLAFVLINTIRHAHTDREMLTHFRQIARCLSPGGVYIVGISLSLYGFESPTEDVWTGSRKGTTVTQAVQYIPPEGTGSKDRDEHVHSHLTITSGKRTRHTDASYTLRTYSLEQWRALIAKSPLEIIGVTDQDGLPTKPSPLGYNVFVLSNRRPSKRTKGARRAP